jgi:hypothetical protein
MANGKNGKHQQCQTLQWQMVKIVKSKNANWKAVKW